MRKKERSSRGGRNVFSAPDPVFDRLVEHEFETQEEYRARNAQNLDAILDFASREVPYYRKAFRRATPDTTTRNPMSVLTALPVLSKLDVMDAGRALVAENLRPGDSPARWWESSGTTGRPIRVLHSAHSLRMYQFLAQRSVRWNRLDPSGKFADMRIPRLLPRGADGSLLGAGETARLDRWRDFPDFSTGPYVGISVMTPMEERIAWLRRERPDYLMAYAETLELLALATGDEPPAESLMAVMAISEQLTPSMRSYVERRFGTPVYQVYGLTEFGLAGTRCEAGRYHVHREHCLIEILDDAGRACAPGEMGRIVITALRNYAMPLIRYDTGDLAEVAAGDCPCGRTLPSFGEIVGRYGRAAYLPAGTMGPVLALREAIETMPADMMRGLREFQIHQYADKRMELRLVERVPLPEAFFAHVRAVWAKATNGGGVELSFRSVDQIPRTGGKSEVFTSDFMPARDGKASTDRTRGAGGSANV